MSNYATSIDVQVTGTRQLTSLNRSLNTYLTHVRDITQAHQQLSGTTTTLNVNVNGLTSAQAKMLVQLSRANQSVLQTIRTNTDWIKTLAQGTQQTNQLTGALQRQINVLSNLTSRQQTQIDTLKRQVAAVNQQANATKQATHHAAGLDSQFLRIAGRYAMFLAIATAFLTIKDSISEAARAARDFDYQTARTTRIIGTGGGNKPLINSLLQEGAVSAGTIDTKDLGNVMYELGTFIKGADNLTRAYRSTLELLIGTEGDARDTTRTLIYTYEQFKDSMDSTASAGEKFATITRLMATAFKDANAEMDEISAGMKYLGPIAKAAQIPLEQVVATLVNLTSQGQVGRMGGTSSGQFIAQLIKSYDESLGGIVHKGNIYKFGMPRRSQEEGGGIDLIRTIQNIVQAARQLPTREAEEFLKAVAGPQNAFRFIGTQGVSAVRQLAEEYVKLIDVTRGNNDAQKQLAATMRDTFDVQAARAWKTLIGETADIITSLANSTGLQKLLKDFADARENRLRVQSDNLATDAKLATLSGMALSKNDIDIIGRMEPTATYLRVLKERKTGNPFLDALGDPVGAGIRYDQESYLRRGTGTDVVGSGSPGEIARIFSLASKYGLVKNGELTPDALNELKHKLVADQDIAARESAKGMSQRGVYRNAIIMAAKAYGVPPELALAIAQTESDFQQFTAGGKVYTSKAGAMGIMQIMPGTGKALGINPANADQNILGGVRYFSQLMKSYGGNVDEALAAYNGGPNAVAAMRRGSTWNETRDYISKVRVREGAFGVEMANRGDVSVNAIIAPTPQELAKRRKAAELAARRKRQDQIDALQSRKQAIELEMDYWADQKSTDGRSKLQVLSTQHRSVLGQILGLKPDDQVLAKRLELDFKTVPSAVQRSINDMLDEERIQYETQYQLLMQRNGPYGFMVPEAARMAQDRMVEAAKRRKDFALADQIASYSGPYAELARKRIEDAEDLRFNRAEYYFMPRADVPTSIRQSYAFTQGLVPRNFIDAPISRALGRSRLRYEDYRIGLETSHRPGYMYGDPYTAELGNVQAMIAANRSRYAGIGFNATMSGEINTEPIREELRGLDNEFRQLSSTLQNIRDKRQLDVFNMALDKMSEAFSAERFATGLGLNQGIGEGEVSYRQRRASALLQLIGIDKREIAALKGKTAGLPSESPILDSLNKNIVRLSQGIQQNEERLAEILNERNRQNYEDMRGGIASAFYGGVIDFYHGNANPLQIAGKVGNAILEQSILQMLQPLTDPLIDSLASQFSAVNTNTEALNANTKALGGEVPSSAKPPASGGAGGKTGSGGGVGGSTTGGALALGRTVAGKSNVGYGLAALGALMNGAETGNWLQGGISGALGGWSVGGPLGAGIGGVLGMIGGLFGSKKPRDPLESARDQSPAFLYAPTQFEYAAYRYRATGRIENTGLNIRDPYSTAPVFNVFIDGVRSSVSVEIGRQTSVGNTSQTNVHMDMHGPH